MNENMANERPTITGYDPHDERKALSADLSRLYRPSMQIPAEREQAIQRAIRDHFAEPPARRIWTKRVLPWAAVAATAGLVCTLWLTTRPPPAAPGQFSAMDLDRSGRIDVLDAFLLARQLHSLRQFDLTSDFNGDGTVDGQDVDALAMKAVALNGRAQS